MQALQAVINSPGKGPLFHYFWLRCVPAEEIISLWCHTHYPENDTLVKCLVKQSGHSISSAGGYKQALPEADWTQSVKYGSLQESRSFRRMGNFVPGSTTGTQDEKQMEYSCNRLQQLTRGTCTSKLKVLEFDADEPKGSPETWWELQHHCRDFRNAPLYSAWICAGLFYQITPSVEISESALRREPKRQLLGSQRQL